MQLTTSNNQTKDTADVRKALDNALLLGLDVPPRLYNDVIRHRRNTINALSEIVKDVPNAGHLTVSALLAAIKHSTALICPDCDTVPRNTAHDTGDGYAMDCSCDCGAQCAEIAWPFDVDDVATVYDMQELGFTIV